jgi:hypothetical protein
MTRLEAVSTVLIGTFIWGATIALALMMVRQGLDDMARPITEPPVGGAHRYGDVEKTVGRTPPILPAVTLGGL